jgi:peptidoglycan/LPS O-acetylase OafA/YrhL
MNLVNINNYHRFDIQGLRGLAILSVILFHFFPKFFPMGYLGVDLFFVISGFLITSIVWKKL